MNIVLFFVVVVVSLRVFGWTNIILYRVYMLGALVFRGSGVEIVCYGPLDTITIAYAFFSPLLCIVYWHLRFYCCLKRTAWYHCVSCLVGSSVGWLTGLFGC